MAVPGPLALRAPRSGPGLVNGQASLLIALGQYLVVCLVIAIEKMRVAMGYGNGSSSGRTTTLGEPRYVRQARPGGVALIDFRGTA
jgi:hypothetical protein